jgi:hypothetical protein
MADAPNNTTLEKHVGFTGTRQGMTEAQAARVARMMASLRGWLHHGDCLGSDAKAHELARGAGMKIAIHPPDKSDLRAFCEGDEVHSPKGYLVRDRDIVDASVGLIATPVGFTEEQRSGTWATIRYAGRVGKPCVIVWPDGTTENRHAR